MISARGAFPTHERMREGKPTANIMADGGIPLFHEYGQE